MAVFPELEGLQLSFQSPCHLEQRSWPLGTQLPCRWSLRCLGGARSQGRGGCGERAPSFCFCLLGDLDKVPHRSGTRLLCPRYVPALQSLISPMGLIFWRRSLGPTISFIGGLPPPTSFLQTLSLVSKTCPLLPCVCINAFSFSKPSEDIVLCCHIWFLRKTRQRQAEGPGTKSGSHGLSWCGRGWHPRVEPSPGSEGACPAHPG